MNERRTIMKSLKRISSILALVLAFVTIPVIGHTQSLTPAKTVMTFDQPVELPGIALPPGSYVFKTSGNGLVQVFDANESRVLGNFLTVPAYRLEPADKTSVLLEE